MKSTINIYGCGGAGIKAVAQFENLASVDYVADLKCYYLDTGLANLNSVEVNKDSCFVFECKDETGRVLTGAGKKRSLVAQSVSNNIQQVLAKFTPVYPLNIVVASAAGGSGSVIMPYAVEAMLAAGYPVIVILIGSHDCGTSVNNTTNTILSLDNFARDLDTPVIMSYHNNQANTRLKEVDAEISTVVKQLAVLCSKQNDGLDDEDLKHWLQFNKVTNVEPQLACLDITNSVKAVEEVSFPVAIASLLREGAETSIGEIGADYYCDGTIPSQEMGELHYVINVSDPAEILDSLTAAKLALEKKTAARPKTQRLGGSAGKGGMVL